MEIGFIFLESAIFRDIKNDEFPKTNMSTTFFGNFKHWIDYMDVGLLKHQIIYQI